MTPDLAARYLDRRIRDSALLRADWTAPSGVHALTTLRRGLGVGISQPPFDSFNLGARCGDDPDAVAHNRAALGWLAELPSPPCWLRQVHGTRVWRFDAPSAHEVEADAAVTDVPGVVLVVLTADCLPLVFAARDGSEVGVAHAGWRGLAAGVLEATVAAMRTPPDQLQAWIGPGAGPNHYEVGEEVRAAFVNDDVEGTGVFDARQGGAASAFVATRPGHWLVDLTALARRRLVSAGLAANAVHGGALCTIADEARFFSHRRDGTGGRMATLVWRAHRGRAGVVEG